MLIIKWLLLITISLAIFYQLLRNEKGGIALTVFFLIITPRELYVPLASGIPTLTAYRAIISALTVYYFFFRPKTNTPIKTPFLLLLFLILFQKFISLILAYDFNSALNGFTIFAIESLLFYYIISNMLVNKNLIIPILKGISYAVIIIALFGFIERYTFFNLVDYLALPDSPRFLPRNYETVYSTFSHQIHFGTALAMGWPICFFLWDNITHRQFKVFHWFLMLPIYAGIYFSGSRGVWLGFIIVFFVFFVLRYPKFIEKISFIILITIGLLLIRPGIWESIYGLAAATFDSQSNEGGSFFYRIDLYHMAYNMIKSSFEKLLFGFGDGAHHAMDIRGFISYGTFGERRFWSWDSQFAIFLLEGGIVGLFLNVILYFQIIWTLFRSSSNYLSTEKPLAICLIATITVFIFMMTNVAIFSPQLQYIFWTCFAIGMKLSHQRHTSKEEIFTIENKSVRTS